MAAVIFAAYLLIAQLADIGFGTIADELREAELVWVVVALILAQSTFIPSGVSVRGGVATPLPLLPCIVLQSAIKFINLTVPSSAGRIGMNLRFLQRMGTPLPEAVAAGAVDDASETIVQVALFLIVIPFVHVSLDTGQFHGTGPDTRLVVAIAAALAERPKVVTIDLDDDPGAGSGELWRAMARLVPSTVTVIVGLGASAVTPDASPELAARGIRTLEPVSATEEALR